MGGPGPVPGGWGLGPPGAPLGPGAPLWPGGALGPRRPPKLSGGKRGAPNRGRGPGPGPRPGPGETPRGPPAPRSRGPGPGGRPRGEKGAAVLGSPGAGDRRGGEGGASRGGGGAPRSERGPFSQNPRLLGLRNGQKGGKKEGGPETPEKTATGWGPEAAIFRGSADPRAAPRGGSPKPNKIWGARGKGENRGGEKNLAAGKGGKNPGPQNPEKGEKRGKKRGGGF